MLARKSVLALALVAAAASALVYIAIQPSGEGSRSAVAPSELVRTPPAPVAALELRNPEAKAAQVEVHTRGKALDVDAPAPVGRQAVDPDSEWSAPVRGLIVDARTGEGVPHVRVQSRGIFGLGVWQAVTDSDGRFESASPRPKSRQKLVAFDEFSGRQLDARRHAHGPAQEGGQDLRWPIEVGPTFRVRLVGQPGPNVGFKLRLVERGLDGELREWPWLDPVAGQTGDELWVRYQRVQHEPHPARVPYLEALAEEAGLGGQAQVRSTLGLQVVDLTVAPKPGIQGRVVDQDGRPVEAAVVALHRGPPQPTGTAKFVANTDEEGRFRLEGLQPGRIWLMVATNHRPALHLDIDLAVGERRWLDLVVQRLEIAGSIRGELVGEADEDYPTAFVRLVSEDGGSTDLVEFAGFMLDFDIFGKSERTGRSPFVFEDLPAGRYRISLTPLDGRSYFPETLSVEPPCDGVQFNVGPATSENDLRLRVRDRVTLEECAEISMLWRVGWMWASEVKAEESGASLGSTPSNIPLTLLIAAPLHRPAVASLASASRSADGDWLEVDLAPGWGMALVLVDAQRTIGNRDMDLADVLPMPVPAGARVLAGGKEIGRSDETGLALCASDGPISDFEVVLPGWAVLSVERFRGHAETPDGIGFVWMARE